MTADEKILDKVQKLLAKAERTNHPEEAQAFTAKAQALMLQHSIDEAMLAAAGRATDRGEVGVTKVVIDFSPTQAPKMSLLTVVGRAFDCRVVFVKGRDYQRLTKRGRPTDIQTAMIFGYESDRRATEMIYTSLLLQSEVEFRTPEVQERMNRDGMYVTGPAKGGFALKWRNSFQQGYTAGVAGRFAEIRKATVTEAASRSTGVELVLASKSDAVEAAVSAYFPKLGTSRSSAGGYAGGRSAGAAAAQRADLGQKRTGTGTAGALR